MRCHRILGGSVRLFGLLSAFLITTALDAASLTIRVLDERGTLVADASVGATRADGSGVKALRLGDGIFLVDDVGLKSVIDVSHARLGTVRAEVRLTPDTLGVDIILPDGTTRVRRRADLSAVGGGDLDNDAPSFAFPIGGCPLDCPPNAFIEPEDCGDDTNGGCNSEPPAFTEAQCGDTWCGTAWADDGMRDTDWYLVTHGGGTLSATVASQIPVTLFIVDGIGDCIAAVVGDIGCGDACMSIATASADLPPGTYVVFVAPGDCGGGGIFEGFPCGPNNNYVLTIDGCDPSAPPNDLCEDAESLAVDPGGSIDVDGTTEGATFDDVGFCGTANTAPGVWYSITGNGNTLTASTCNQAAYDTKISVFCGDCLPGDLVCVTGQDDAPGCAGFTTEVSWCAQDGAEYLILVHGFSTDTGDFTLTVSDDDEACMAEINCLPTGACCLCDCIEPVCTIETEDDCLALGGVYLGDGTDCELTGTPIVFERSPNLAIPDNDIDGVSDTIVVAGVGPILDLNVDLDLQHSWVGDLCVTVTSPDGVPVTLIKRMGFDGECDAASCCGCSADNMDIILDDEAADSIEDQCEADLTGNYVPEEPLSVYDGQNADGVWTITVNDNAGADLGTLVRWSLHFGQGTPPCEGEIDCEPVLESVDVAIRDAVTRERVFVRGFCDGTVEHKFYTPTDGYTPWSVVPDPGGGWLPPAKLEAVEAIALDPRALIYLRAFDNGLFQQNVYTEPGGWTGWFDVPHPDDAGFVEGTDVVESVDIEPFNGLPSSRLFVRAWRSGLIEQCIYTPEDGYTPWSDIPPMGDAIDIIEGMEGETVESVQVTAEGGIFSRRIFVIGLRESRRVFQNIYDPAEGYTGWVRVRNQGTADLGVPSPLASVDIQGLGGGVVVYVRGFENGRVQHKFYTPADGFSRFTRFARNMNPMDKVLESCCVEYFTLGLFGERIYLRAFEDGTVQQSLYDPAGGQTPWQTLP